MVIKTVLMGIPILVSRSGFTQKGVEQLAQQAGLTLMDLARESAIALSGVERIIFDSPDEQEDIKNGKGADADIHEKSSAQRSFYDQQR